MGYFRDVGVVFLTLAACTAVGGNVTETIYEHICDGDKTFRDKMATCIYELPKQEQLIFQLCGSLISNDTEKYENTLEGLCPNASQAIEALTCLDHIRYVFFHLNDTDHHHHHHHHSEEESDSEETGEEGSEDTSEHEHDRHLEWYYSQECFKKLYEEYNITSSAD